jgi:hypothetical protein
LCETSTDEGHEGRLCTPDKLHCETRPLFIYLKVASCSRQGPIARLFGESFGVYVDRERTPCSVRNQRYTTGISGRRETLGTRHRRKKKGKKGF